MRTSGKSDFGRGGRGQVGKKGVQVRSDILQRNIYKTRDVQAGTRGVYYIAAKALAGSMTMKTEFRFRMATGWNLKCDPDETDQKYKKYLELYERTKGL